jgi:DNA modification methylase
MEGAIPGQIIENILYYYTEPFDKVVDPMAGGGTTVDVCKAMYRRYLAYDINPKRDDVKRHDIREGYPPEAKSCDLIFLDPPYYNMVFNLFSSIGEFYSFIKKLARDSYATVKDQGVVALLMADWTEGERYCLSGECYRIFTEAKFTFVDHVSCPQSTEQAAPQQIEYAKRERKLLGRNRDLYVFKKV